MEGGKRTNARQFMADLSEDDGVSPREPHSRSNITFLPLMGDRQKKDSLGKRKDFTISLHVCQDGGRT